jgi:hypothetical protein
MVTNYPAAPFLHLHSHTVANYLQPPHLPSHYSKLSCFVGPLTHPHKAANYPLPESASLPPCNMVANYPIHKSPSRNPYPTRQQTNLLYSPSPPWFQAPMHPPCSSVYNLHREGTCRAPLPSPLQTILYSLPYQPTHGTIPN